VLTQDIDIVGIEKAAGTQFRHDFGETCAGYRETAFAAAGHAEMVDHLVADVPGAVHHDPAGEGVVIGRIQSFEPNRLAMGSDIRGTGPIGSCRARVRAWCVGEALEPAGMQRVGAATVRDPMRVDAAIGKTHQMQPGHTRVQGEIGNADEVLVGDALAVSVQCIERTPQQSRGNRRTAVASAPRSGPRHSGGAS